MRKTRGLLLVAVTAVVLAAGLVLSPARAEEPPLRSGTILGGTGVKTGGGDPWEPPAAQRSGCEHALECLAWLQSGCNPALTGHDPVLTASIVDVGDLADGRTSRGLNMVAPRVPPWGLFPGVVIQHWREDCSEIADAKVHTLGSDTPCRWDGHSRCQFRIPADARWMTVSGYVTTARLDWTLA